MVQRVYDVIQKWGYGVIMLLFLSRKSNVMAAMHQITKPGSKKHEAEIDVVCVFPLASGRYIKIFTASATVWKYLRVRSET